MKRRTGKLLFFYKLLLLEYSGSDTSIFKNYDVYGKGMGKFIIRYIDTFRIKEI